jgi:hypothetical protein
VWSGKKEERKRKEREESKKGERTYGAERMCELASTVRLACIKLPHDGGTVGELEQTEALIASALKGSFVGFSGRADPGPMP